MEFWGLYWGLLVYGSYIYLEPRRKGRGELVTTQMTTISWPVNPFTYATGSLIGMNANVTVPCDTHKCCSSSIRKFETTCVVISNTLLEVRGPCAFSRQAAACCPSASISWRPSQVHDSAAVLWTASCCSGRHKALPQQLLGEACMLPDVSAHDGAVYPVLEMHATRASGTVWQGSNLRVLLCSQL